MLGSKFVVSAAITLVAGLVAVLCTAASAEAQLFEAAFGNDEVNFSPGTPDVGTWSTISTAGGTILVRAGLGDLTDKPVELERTGRYGLAIVGSIVGTPPTSGVFTAQWRALVHKGSYGGTVSLFSTDGRLIASVAHAPNQLLIYNNSGVPGTGVSWATDIAQRFEVDIDLVNKETSLRIDGVPVKDNAPFADEGAADMNRIALTIGGTKTISFVVDDIEIAPSRGCGAQMDDAENISTLANWIEGLQFTAPDQPSFGAVQNHHTAGYRDKGGNLYLRVVPYNANLALWGLLHSESPRKLEVVENWINWYLSHLDLSRKPAGVVLDHWYLKDGTGETTCPPGIDIELCDHHDASDSYASTLLGLAWAYIEAGGEPEFLEAHRQELETVAGVVLALQDVEDGLTWAKESYRVKYVMDNSETFWGLGSMGRLEHRVFNDPKSARIYAAAETRVRRGILRHLFDRYAYRYRIAKFEDGTVEDGDLTTWYPGTVPIVWPHLYGVTPPNSRITKEQMRTLNGAWDWTTSIVDLKGFMWPSIGYAALRGGDCLRARAQANFVAAQKIPDFFAYPWTVDDAGFLILTLSELAR